MKKTWKRTAWCMLLLAGCGSSPDNQTTAGSTPNTTTGSVASARESHFAILDGQLTAAKSAGTYYLQVDPPEFSMPSNRVLLKLTVDHERGKTVTLTSADGAAAGDGLLLTASAGNTVSVGVSGSGEFRIHLSLAGDLNGDQRVDETDLAGFASRSGLVPGSLAFREADLNGDGQIDARDETLAAQNLGVSTTIRPISVRMGLDPSVETYSSLEETLNATGSLRGQVTPGATVVVQRVPSGTSNRDASDPIPVNVDSSGAFTFQAPLDMGDNPFQVVATDQFGQTAVSGALISRVDQPSEPPSRLDAALQNRIWLLDVHNNNYLFRGPLPLTSLEDTGKVDFQSMFTAMNQRLVQEKAPISTLPTEFVFTEIVLFTNRSTTSASHGDEGYSLHQIYKSILGADPATPTPDDQFPTSLFTKPLDNTVTDGQVFTQTVGNTTYTVHPSIVWQPTAASSVGQPPTSLPDGPSGYQSVVRSTFPIVSIAPNPDSPQTKLTNPLSNISVATRTVQQLMQVDNTQNLPHFYYLHCINGHDRTGMITTGYVLGAYGASFNYDLATAYKYGQMGSFLPGAVPDGVDPDINFWQKLENDRANSGELKPIFMQAVQALAFLYYHPDGADIQPAPTLPQKVIDTQLWQAGYTFTEASTLPIRETPADFLRVRP